MVECFVIQLFFVFEKWFDSISRLAALKYWILDSTLVNVKRSSIVEDNVSVPSNRKTRMSFSCENLFDATTTCLIVRWRYEFLH